MTQENDSLPVPGVTPETTATPAKKPRTATKKATPKKTAPRRKASEKSVAPEASPSAGEQKTTEKPRATAKNAAKPSAAPKAAAKTTQSTVAPAVTPEVAPAPAAKKKPAPAEKPVKPARVAKAETPTIPATESAATPEKSTTPATRKARPARAKTAKPAVAPKAPVVPEQKVEPIPAPATPQGASRAAQNAPAQTAVPPRTNEQKNQQAKASAGKQPLTADKVLEQTPEQTQQAPSGEQTAQAQAETRTEGAPDAPAKPASRRSRRGGRRRNKSKAAAQEKAAQEKAAQEGVAQENPTQAPHPQDGSPQQDTPELAAVAEPQASEPVAASETAREASTETTGSSPKKTSRKGASSKKAPKEAEKKDTDLVEDEDDDTSPSGAKRKMFISVLSGELVEVVLAEEGAVVEYYVEMQHQAKVKGNIYKGVVSNIDANLQAAFISYAGGVKNGFLQIDEIHPEYYAAHHEAAKGRKYPPIQKVLKPGQEILVQVVKEPSGTKGAFLTSYLSLPGRFLVLTPGREQIGVSRKVEIDEERVRLRALLEGLKPGKGLGVIVRTASTGTSKTNLQRDLQFLKRLWKDVRAKGQTASAPSLIYEELDLSTRAIRDYLTNDVQDVWIDDAATASQVTELASLLFPKKQHLVHLHSESAQTLFERFSLQRQLDHIHSREVSLPSGGSLVIDKTEALTAIDINSGRSSGKTTFEDMAHRTNVEAANAIPLQLRLRDIGGQIVADFIEMRDRDHWREVEKIVRNGMKGDRARYDVGKISPFGMLEIVRQRLGSSAISISTEACPCCKGTGIRRNMEWQAMQALRDINKQLRQATANNQTALAYHTETELAFYLLNTKRPILQNMENEAGVSLSISPKKE